MNWFKVKVSYEAVTEDGLMKRMSEAYLIDALTFAEAEEKAYKELEGYTDVRVSGVKVAKIAEIIREKEATKNKWYRCKVMMLTIDENKGTEKKMPFVYMVEAPDFKAANTNLYLFLAEYLCDLEIASITETDIVEVLDYETPTE